MISFRSNVSRFNCILCVYTLMLLSAGPGLAASGDFRVTVQPGAYDDLGCKKFDIQLDIEGFGVVSLNQGVCAGWFYYPSDGSNKEPEDHYMAFNAYQYDVEDARHGVDTSTINVLVSGDKAWVEWKSVPQGSGLHVEHEYRIYQKGKNTPLLSRNIKSYAKSGWSSRVNEHLIVNKFTPESLELQIISTYSQILGTKYPLYYWDENGNGYVADINLRANVSYVFPDNRAVDIFDAKVIYQPKPKDVKSEIARYFHVEVDSLLSLAGQRYELKLDNARFEKLFSPVRSDIARSLHELMNAGP